MNIKKYTKIIASASCGVFLLACDDDSTVNSSDVNSSQIFATFEIYSDGSDQVYAAAQLTKDQAPSPSSDGDVFIRLVSGDKLWFSTGDNIDDLDFGEDLFSSLEQLEQTQTLMTRAQYNGDYFFNSDIFYHNAWYAGRLPPSAEGQYAVALLREIDTDAKYSTVQMPAAFSLLAPESNDSYSRSNDVLAIEWSPTQIGVSMSLEIKSSCINGDFDSYSQIESSDIGMAILDAGTLDSVYLNGDCTTTVNVIKTQLGQFDSTFDGGRISAHQIRSVTITTTD